MHRTITGLASRGALPLALAGALVCAGLGWTAARARAGGCAGPSANLALMTPADAAAPSGAGLLIAGQMSGRPLGRASGPRDDLEFEGVLVQGSESIALRLEHIAPGLARLMPEHTPTPGRWELRSGDLSLPVRFSARVGQPPLSAPALAAVWIEEPDGSAIGGIGGPHGSSRPPPARLMARLAAARPAGAVALVLHLAGGRQRAFAATATPTTSQIIPVYAPRGGRCAPFTYGSAVPQGVRVFATFVDAFGRESPPSAAVVVESR